MSDLVKRLRTWVHAVHAVPVGDLLDEAADEMERMTGEVDRLNAEVSILIRECQNQKNLLVNGPAPAADGVDWPTSGPGAVLTDAEREAVLDAALAYESDPDEWECAKIAATLRGLLDRLGGGE